MTQPDPPPVSVNPPLAVVVEGRSINVPVDEMGRYVQTDLSLIEEGVCRDCGRLLYRVTKDGELVDVWHPHTVLSGEPTVRFDGTHVTSQRGECAGAELGVGRPDPSAFVLGVPLMPLGPEPAAVELPCYICGDEGNHHDGESMQSDECPSGITRAAADELRDLVGLLDVEHERRRDDRV